MLPFWNDDRNVDYRTRATSFTERHMLWLNLFSIQYIWGGGVNSCPRRNLFCGVGRFVYDSQQSPVATKRSTCNVNREPYPGIYFQIRQDFRPIVLKTEYWDAPWVGASSGLREDEGLAALVTAQEGDSLFRDKPLSCGYCPDDHWVASGHSFFIGTFDLIHAVTEISLYCGGSTP